MEQLNPQNAPQRPLCIQGSNARWQALWKYDRCPLRPLLLYWLLFSHLLPHLLIPHTHTTHCKEMAASHACPNDFALELLLNKRLCHQPQQVMATTCSCEPSLSSTPSSQDNKENHNSSTEPTTTATASGFWATAMQWLLRRTPQATIASVASAQQPQPAPTADEQVQRTMQAAIATPLPVSDDECDLSAEFGDDQHHRNAAASAAHWTTSYNAALQHLEQFVLWSLKPMIQGVPGLYSSIEVEREQCLALSNDDVELAVSGVFADTRSFVTRITDASLAMAFGVPATTLTPIWRNLRTVALVASLYGHDVQDEMTQSAIVWCLVEGEAGRAPRVALRKVVRKLVKHLIRRSLSRVGAKVVGSVFPVGLVYEFCIDTSTATHIHQRAVRAFRDNYQGEPEEGSVESDSSSNCSDNEADSDNDASNHNALARTVDEQQSASATSVTATPSCKASPTCCDSIPTASRSSGSTCCSSSCTASASCPTSSTMMLEYCSPLSKREQSNQRQRNGAALPGTPLRRLLP
jgi:hypothetical protein